LTETEVAAAIGGHLSDFELSAVLKRRNLLMERF